MRQFYLLFENQKWNAVSAKLTWSHYRELIWIDDINKINYYINISIDKNLSYRELHRRIKNNEYESLDNKTKEKLVKKEELLPQDFIKNTSATVKVV